MKIIGIDLGTTNSLVSIYTPDGPVLIPNVFGENLTPSVVGIADNGEVFAGKIAKERLLTHPNMTAALFKRSMGSGKTFRLGRTEFRPEELSAMLIRKLKEDAESYLGAAVEEAVISVPAYFNDTQRRATKTAGELAGLKAERIVTEPTAAALAYGLHDRADYTKYLVFDLGGGTFDVSVMEKYEQVMEVRAVAGDNFLGGEDFTQVLAERFVKHHKLQDLSQKELGFVSKAAEGAKLAFTGRGGQVVMHCVLDEQLYEMPVTYSDYERWCEPLFARLRAPLKRALSDASVQLGGIDTILLVGGASKMSLIKSFVSKMLGRLPSSYIDPEEAVALGAAVHSALKSRTLNEIVLTDVCPFTLGTSVAIHNQNGRLEGGHYCPIIDRNSVIPISRSQRLFTLRDGQDTIRIDILQGESRLAKDNLLLGEMQVSVPPGPAGKESVDVRYTYDINGILEAAATIVSTGETETLLLEKSPGQFSHEELAERMAALAALKIHPRDKDENRLLLARAERLYEENLGETRQILAENIMRFESLLNAQDERVIRDFARQLALLLDEML